MVSNTKRVIDKMKIEAQSDTMWRSRSLSLLESIKHLDIDIRDDTLFEALKRNENDEILKVFLKTVPGWDDSKTSARQHIGYLMMEPRRLAIKEFGPMNA